MKKTILILLFSGIVITVVLLCTILFTVRKTASKVDKIAEYKTDVVDYKQVPQETPFNLHREMGINDDSYYSKKAEQNRPDEINYNYTQPQNRAYENKAGSMPPPPSSHQNPNIQKHDFDMSNQEGILHKSEKDFTTPLENSLTAKIKSCIPYKETLKAQYMGVDMIYKISIDGWHNGKCILNFETNATGTGSDFMQEYGIDPSEVSVSAFTPKIRCEFTRAQLLYVGDAILEENSRGNSGSKMLKNPNDITFPEPDKMSLSDLKLLDLLLRQKACKITNWNEFKSIIQEVVDFLSF